MRNLLWGSLTARLTQQKRRPWSKDDQQITTNSCDARVVSLVCTEVNHYNISPCSIASSALPIFAQEVCWLFQSLEGGGEGDDGRISVELWMSHSQRILSPLSLKCFYYCSHLKFLWTPQGTVVYGTIKCNLRGYSFLNHELTNCPDEGDSFKLLKELICGFRKGGFLLTYCTYIPTVVWHVH